MASDDKEADPDKISDADAVAFASEVLGGGDIKHEEGAAPEENLLVVVAASAEAITAGIVSANGPKEKPAAGMDNLFSYFSSNPLSQDTEKATMLMAKEED